MSKISAKQGEQLKLVYHLVKPDSGHLPCMIKTTKALVSFSILHPQTSKKNIRTPEVTLEFQAEKKKRQDKGEDPPDCPPIYPTQARL